MGFVDPSGNQKTPNVELNVVPFIDLMSCLVAFLLVTAVWTQNAQITGTNKSGAAQGIDEPYLEPGLLLSRSGMHLGLTDGWQVRIPRDDSGSQDWGQLGESLAMLIDYPTQGDRELNELKIAGEDDIPYHELVSAMDIARQRGFRSLGVVDPPSLPVRFVE